MGERLVNDQVQLVVDNRGVIKVENEIYLSEGDVIHIHPNLNFAEVPTSKVKDVKASLAKVLGNRHCWAANGAKCEVLRSGGEWITGTVRLEIVFQPDILDEPENTTPQATQAIFVQYRNQ